MGAGNWQRTTEGPAQGVAKLGSAERYVGYVGREGEGGELAKATMLRIGQIDEE